MRKSKSKKAKTIKKLKIGTKVTVLSTSGSWRKIKVGGKTGYVLKKYVYINTRAPKLKGSTYNKGKTVASFAQRFVGNPYVWGGTDPVHGADCSGFAQHVYAQFGIGLPRTSAAQSQYGMKIPVSEAAPGDLIFYAKNGQVYHVVIYIGNGRTVEAASTRSGICSHGVNYANAVWATRLLS